MSGAFLVGIKRVRCGWFCGVSSHSWGMGSAISELAREHGIERTYHDMPIAPDTLVRQRLTIKQLTLVAKKTQSRTILLVPEYLESA